MTSPHLPADPLAAHEVVMQRAQQMADRRRDERRKPLPEQALANVKLVHPGGPQLIQAEVLDVSVSGMRLAAFANDCISRGDRCEIQVHGTTPPEIHWATVRWVKPHPLIQVFGVQFDA